MKYTYLLILFLLCFSAHINAQENNTDSTWKNIYRATEDKINNLVHTKLEITPDYSKSQLKGKATLTLTPHFYPVNTLTMDAKAMDISSVTMNDQKLNFEYDKAVLKIQLGQSFEKGSKYTVVIDYVAKPNEWTGGGSVAITDAKGLYFINPDGSDKEKPVQIWTQGETEGSSVWFPTIDEPGQKTTQEIYLSVPDKYVTLSNGLLLSSVKNPDGSRTDYWKMDKPHAPYLFFIGVGEFAIVKDKYKDKEVSYYVEKKYEPVARKIFGLTPEMIKFFEDYTGVPYVWDKYAQIVCRDYVSGAMENTTAVIHQETAQQTARELKDGNQWEDVISHELFHHWFGDLVTTESWSNLSVNESFATYGEVLWREYKYGREKADEQVHSDRSAYLNSDPDHLKDLVRFYYRDKEDMFDVVSYQKGGCVLHMLRHYIGDKAFREGLKKYLNDNAYGTGEMHQLRLALESVSGKDLNWFFNQWFFSNGHPQLKVSYSWDATAKKAKVNVKQNQKHWMYILPTTIDLFYGKQRKSYPVNISKAEETFEVPAPTQPDFIDLDTEGILLIQREEEKSAKEWENQLKNGGYFMARRTALNELAQMQPDKIAVALNDPNDNIVKNTLYLMEDNLPNKAYQSTLPDIEKIAKNYKDQPTRAAAINLLAKMKPAAYKNLYMEWVKDSSYAVSMAAFKAWSKTDENAASLKLNEMIEKGDEMDKKLYGSMQVAMTPESKFDEVYKKFEEMNLQEKFNNLDNYASFFLKCKDEARFKKGFQLIESLKGFLPPQYHEQFDEYMNVLKKERTN